MAVDWMPGHQGTGMPEGEGTRPSWPTPDGADGGTAGTARPPSISPPAISLPKGGGAVRGIGEKFSTNPATGTGSLSIPLPLSAGRSGFGPSLTLSYDSGNAHGPFGMGWTIGLPSITRKTDKGLPTYDDAGERDVFLLSGAEDLVPFLDADGKPERPPPRTVGSHRYVVVRYRPRIEGLHARIERWTREDGDVHWRSISRDNITSLYGRDDDSRIFDPADRRRVFSWLICESYDDKGNAIEYSYKREDSVDVDVDAAHERHRNNNGGKRRTANRYLKSVRYGNRVNRLAPPEQAEQEWLFEVVFDYGDHDQDTPTPGDKGEWQCRNDPFSSYRAGFEIRTYRLCQRILMFHHFPGEAEVGANCLVRSMTLKYRSSRGIESDRQRGHPAGAFLESVVVAGHRRDGSGYLTRELPPLELEYSTATQQPEVQEPDAASLENLPVGLDGSGYQLVDLDGESIAGVLTEQAGAWFYKPNLGEGHFGPLQTLPAQPSASLSGGQSQLLDLAGDGTLDLVTLGGPVPGFFERTEEDGWAAHQAFASLPALDWSEPNLRFVDCNGDGRADVLITEDDAIVVYPSLGEDGFGPAVRWPTAHDEDAGPRLVFADGTQSVYLADFSGDGLTDLARVRNGEVCYWPNLGYGQFGAKVVMDASPWFDRPDLFDHRRLRLADTDGTGPTDMIYLSGDGADLYVNQMGNSWSKATRVPAFPPVDDVTSVSVVDLLGRGTACLVWSSPLPGDAGRHVRYIDLMGTKPHLLTRIKNNLGAETVVTYASSTAFYLADKAAGRPWVTRLPFPVHVVERVETFDRISHNRFATRYTYHHGYFDGVEREFGGFGLVEQWSTEAFTTADPGGQDPPGTNLQVASQVPPVLTRTWLHTGAYLGGERVASFFAGLLSEQDLGEYYREPAWRDDDVEASRHLLDDTVLPNGLTVEEEREACRALRGAMLRQEVYALDRTASDDYPHGHPYTVAEQNFSVQVLQRRGPNRHAVLLTHGRETVTYHYERNPADPRIEHTLTLKVDDYGNVLRSIAVGYGRADVPARLPVQDETHMTLTVNRVANCDNQPDWRHIGLPVETRTYEVVKPPTTGLRFGWEELQTLVAALFSPDHTEPSVAKTIPFQQWDWRRRWDPQLEPGGPANSRLRLIEQVRTFYRPDDLGAAQNEPRSLLPLGTVESLAVPGESYRLAFPPGLLADVYRRPRDIGEPSGSALPEQLLPDPDAVLGGPGAAQGGYVDLDGNGSWWVPAGRVHFSPGSADTPAQELAFARQHFFLAHRYRDPFHTESLVTYDDYDLLPVETRDALGNLVTVGERSAVGVVTAGGNDYRVLQPWLVTDPNGNRSAVAFDTLGRVVGTAVMGKPLPSPVEGDSLAGFEADLPDEVVREHLADPLAKPYAILRRATTRLVYDLFAYQRTSAMPDPQPAVVSTLARETHDALLRPGEQTRIQHSLSYSDGFGREIQKKVQAEPGPVPKRDAAGEIIVGTDRHPELTQDDMAPRWVGSGWTVFNNKGNPVRQYEPFFTDTHRFEFDVRIGVSPVRFYDPLERVVATLYPDHTWEKVVLDPWRQETWDANDTVSLEPQKDPHLQYFLVRPDGTSRLPVADYLPTWLALRTDPAYAEEASLRWADARIRQAEISAAGKATIHAGTPTVAYADSLGRTFLTAWHNRFKYRNSSLAEEFHRMRFVLDVEGNRREVIDAENRVVMRYSYDMLGNRIHQASMEAGERWMLNDVAGNPLYAWDSGNHRSRTTYDPLRRPTASFALLETGVEALVGRSQYGETQPSPERGNLRGKVVRIFDQAGVVVNEGYDFKGNLQRTRRQLAQAYSTTLDWSKPVLLEAETYTSRTHHDALSRPLQMIAPHSSKPGATVNVVQLTYNQANLLEQVHVWLSQKAEPTGWFAPATASLRPVANVDYDAKGQRCKINYATADGKLVTTSYSYDHETSRLRHLSTRRGVDPLTGQEPSLQDVHYTYDPVGNITGVRDDAQQTIFFNNRRVDPSADYVYDAVYRLIEATGREHLGQVGGSPLPHSYNDAPHVGLPHPGDARAMGTYLERYVYEPAGNLLSMQHLGTAPSHPGWTRTYTYDEPSQLQPGRKSNRLTSSTVGGLADTYSKGGDGYDQLGNLLRMPQLQRMAWDFKNQLRMVQRQAVNAADDEGLQRQGERTWYVYDADGQRVRKVTELATGQVKEQRVCLEGLEIYHKGGSNPLVRETLHVMHDLQRIALVETRTQGSDGSPAQLIRYQFGNHLGSAVLELDDRAQILSYEEYYPYGSTAYQATSKALEGSRKRYRYTAEERDDESGLYYHGARYYAPWLARWVSPDPAGTVDGPNLYSYARLNPMVLTDPTGRQSEYAAGILRRSLENRARNQPIISAAQKLRAASEQRDPAAKAYAQQLQNELRNARNEGMKVAFVVWALMAITVAAGVAGGLTGGAALGAMAKGAAPTLGMKVAASGLGGLVGGTFETGSEQLLRLGLGERLLSWGEAGIRIGASTALPMAGELLHAAVGSAVKRIAGLLDFSGEVEGGMNRAFASLAEEMRGGGEAGRLALFDTDVLVNASKGNPLFLQRLRERTPLVTPHNLAEFLDPQALPAGQIAQREAFLREQGVEVFQSMEKWLITNNPQALDVFEKVLIDNHEVADAVLAAVAKATGLQAFTAEKRLPGMFADKYRKLQVPVSRIKP
jgi:RHS repeat-associated protein